ncbi:MAG: ATP-grasp domain-containing protein [Planctomycetota bacterium]
MSARTLLVVCGGAEAVPGIEAVKRLGVRVVVSDRDPDAPGFAVADDRILESTYDAAATAAAAASYAARRGLHGVLSIAADVPKTVAAVAARLGLPGPSAETAELATDKLAMKERFAAAGVPVPWFAPLESAAHLALLRAERRAPLVVKPVDSRGARGVLVVGAETEAAFAFECARAHSPSGRVMVEEFLPGPQISTESAILAGRVHTCGFSDRNYEELARFAPYVIEDGGCQPSVHLETARAAADEVLQRAAAAIGLARGTLKGDLVLVPGRGPVVIEVAPRLSGGWLATDQIPLSTDVDLVQVAARLALGEEVRAEEATPRAWRPVAVRYFFPPPGRLVAVRGADAAARAPGVRRLALFARPGDVLGRVTDHTKRAGMVLTTGATREEAVARARSAVRAVEFEVEDTAAPADRA